MKLLDWGKKILNLSNLAVCSLNTVYFRLCYSTSFGLTINTSLNMRQNRFNCIFFGYGKALYQQNTSQTLFFKQATPTLKPIPTQIHWVTSKKKSGLFFSLQNRLYLNIYRNITDIIFPQLHVCTVQMRQKIKLERCLSFISRLLSVNKAAVGHTLERRGEKFTQDALLLGSVETTTQQNETKFRKHPSLTFSLTF